MAHILHATGSYPLLFTLTAQFFVLFQAWKSRDKLMMAQAACMIGANALASAALALRPPSPPQIVPDLMGSVAALFLLTPAVVALQKLRSQKQPQKEQAHPA